MKFRLAFASSDVMPQFKATVWLRSLLGSPTLGGSSRVLVIIAWCMCVCVCDYVTVTLNLHSAFVGQACFSMVTNGGLKVR